MKNPPIFSDLKNSQIRTALLLAAGTGSRLAPLTDKSPKCLVPVNEISILERLVDTLRSHNFKRLVIVVGHRADAIRNFLGTRIGDMEITYITSQVYKTTNNIYSLWLARKEINDPFLLIESDLVFDPEMLKDMLQPDRIAVSKLQSWMNGTTVTINSHQTVKAFQKNVKKTDDKHYKTVNIYSLSTRTWRQVRKRLDQHISNNMVNGYYETVFADMVTEDCLSFAPVFFDADRWYEIDTLADLRAASQICTRYHKASARIPGHDVSGQKALDIAIFSKRLPALIRAKSESRRHFDTNVPSLILPALPLTPQPV